MAVSDHQNYSASKVRLRALSWIVYMVEGPLDSIINPVLTLKYTETTIRGQNTHKDTILLGVVSCV